MLIAVLQMNELESLNSAKKYLEEQGFKAEVGSFADLSKSDHQNWMTPENGAYILYLEKDKYAPAMDKLGKFFGYKG